MASNNTLSLYQGQCPAGLGGPSCGQATCDSPFVDPTNRTIKPASARSCAQCAPGFEGLNCNICTSQAGACGRAQAAAGASSTIPPGTTIVDAFYDEHYVFSNDTLVCHKQPDPISTTYVQCDIRQPTLSSLFGGANFTMTLAKVLEPDNSSLTGLASWSSAQAGTTLSQVWLGGVEQFYCQSTGCVTNGNVTTSDASANVSAIQSVWTCDTTKCECSANSTFCGSGGSVGVNLGNVIASLNGTLTMPCNYVPSGAGDASGTCQFKSSQIDAILGENGIPLVNCQFGSCVSQSQQDFYWKIQEYIATIEGDGKNNLSPGVKGGIAVLAAVIGLLLGLLLLGLLKRHRASFMPLRQEGPPSVGLTWERITYTVDKSKGGKLGACLGGTKADQLEEGTSMNSIGSAARDLGASPTTSATAAESNKERRILRDVSGTAPPGHLIAILGPSGAGKTTLVELLAGRDKMGTTTGDVKLQAGLLGDPTALNEKVPDELVEDFSAQASGRRLFAFVDQEDQLPEHSTVREALAFAAELSIAENVTWKEKSAVVESTIHTLGLDAIQNRVIGSRRHRGISGGEKRRVSIGIALVARPRILILDEPLSGLDAYNAARVITALRALAYKGEGATTVILTLHQPSSDIFYKLDRSIFLANGRTFYDGTPEEALHWCTKQGRPCPAGYNVADHLLYMSSIDDASQLVTSQRINGQLQMGSNPNVAGLAPGMPRSPTASPLSPGRRLMSYDIASSKGDLLRCSTTSTTWFTQTLELSKRNFRNIRRDLTGPVSHLVIHILVGFLAGGAFFKVKKTIGGFQNRIGSIFFLYMLMLFASLSAITYIASVRALMVKERADGLYSPFAWLVAHMCYDLILLRIIPGICLSIIVYFMVGLKNVASDFFQFLLISVIFYIVVALYMMILGAVFENLSMAVLLGGAFVLFNIGFAGFMLNLDTLPAVVKWVQWFCPMKYALEAVTINEVEGLTIEDQLSGVPFDIPASSIANNLFGLTGSYYRDLLVLALAFTLGLAAILSLAVWQRMKDRR